MLLKSQRKQSESLFMADMHKRLLLDILYTANDFESIVQYTKFIVLHLQIKCTIFFLQADFYARL